jgi:hypothetical protein
MERPICPLTVDSIYQLNPCRDVRSPKCLLIEATGVLGVDLLWLNGNYQRALFHRVRKSSVIRLRELAEPRRRAELVCFLESAKKSGVGRSE